MYYGTTTVNQAADTQAARLVAPCDIGGTQPRQWPSPFPGPGAAAVPGGATQGSAKPGLWNPGPSDSDSKLTGGLGRGRQLQDSCNCDGQQQPGPRGSKFGKIGDGRQTA